MEKKSGVFARHSFSIDVSRSTRSSFDARGKIASLPDSDDDERTRTCVLCAMSFGVEVPPLAADTRTAHTYTLAFV